MELLLRSVSQKESTGGVAEASTSTREHEGTRHSWVQTGSVPLLRWQDEALRCLGPDHIFQLNARPNGPSYERGSLVGALLEGQHGGGRQQRGTEMWTRNRMPCCLPVICNFVGVVIGVSVVFSAHQALPPQSLSPSPPDQSRVTSNGFHNRGHRAAIADQPKADPGKLGEPRGTCLLAKISAPSARTGLLGR